jgi:hypothetical protein
MRFAGRVIEVEIRRILVAASARAESSEMVATGEQRATYRLLEGDSLHARHHGDPVVLRPG